MNGVRAGLSMDADKVHVDTLLDFYQTDIMLCDIVKPPVPEATHLSSSSASMRYQPSDCFVVACPDV